MVGPQEVPLDPHIYDLMTFLVAVSHRLQIAVPQGEQFLLGQHFPRWGIQGVGLLGQDSLGEGLDWAVLEVEGQEWA